MCLFVFTASYLHYWLPNRYLQFEYEPAGSWNSKSPTQNSWSLLLLPKSDPSLDMCMLLLQHEMWSQCWLLLSLTYPINFEVLCLDVFGIVFFNLKNVRIHSVLLIFPSITLAQVHTLYFFFKYFNSLLINLLFEFFPLPILPMSHCQFNIYKFQLTI